MEMANYTPTKYFSVKQENTNKYKHAEEKIDGAVRKELLDSRSDFITKTVIEKVDELDMRGFFSKRNQTIDDFTNQEKKRKITRDFDSYLRVPPIHQFFDRGIEGEIDLVKILREKQDCFENGARDVVKIWRTAQRISRQVEINPSLREKLLDIEEEAAGRKPHNKMTPEFIAMIKRQADNYNNEMDLV